MTFGTQIKCVFGILRQSADQIWIFIKWKMAYGCHIKIIFWPQLSIQLVGFQSNFMWGSSFSQNFGNRTDTCIPQNVFLFSNAVWSSASGAFRIVSTHLLNFTSLWLTVLWHIISWLQQRLAITSETIVRTSQAWCSWIKIIHFSTHITGKCTTHKLCTLLAYKQV